MYNISTRLNSSVNVVITLMFTFLLWSYSVKNARCLTNLIYYPLVAVCILAALINLFVDITNILYWITTAIALVVFIAFIVDILGSIIYMLGVRNKNILKTYLYLAYI